MKKAIWFYVVLIVISVSFLYEYPSLRNILNPVTSTRIWTVTGYDKNQGRHESFWLKNSAKKHAEKIKDLWPLIRIKNEITGEETDFKDEWDEYMKNQPPEMFFKMEIISGSTPFTSVSLDVISGVSRGR